MDNSRIGSVVAGIYNIWKGGWEGHKIGKGGWEGCKCVWLLVEYLRRESKMFWATFSLRDNSRVSFITLNLWKEDLLMTGRIKPVEVLSGCLCTVFGMPLETFEDPHRSETTKIFL